MDCISLGSASERLETGGQDESEGSPGWLRSSPERKSPHASGLRMVRTHCHYPQLLHSLLWFPCTFVNSPFIKLTSHS